MTDETIQNEFGFFGKLPIAGDFLHQVLPQDFANGFHEWLQVSMAHAREALADDFLTYYLNCPSWKFLIGAGVCGEQAVVGVTIPSVDQVGRYFNFTLATVLPHATDPMKYVINNRDGFEALELLALEILENDYGREEIELKVRSLAELFSPVAAVNDSIEASADYLQLKLDQPLPFPDQAGTLLGHLLIEKLGAFSVWWYGQEGQVLSNMAVCKGMPCKDVYMRLLTLDSPPERREEELDYIDKIIAGEV